MVEADPSFEEMAQVVSKKQVRPLIPDNWQQDKVRFFLLKLQFLTLIWIFAVDLSCLPNN